MVVQSLKQPVLRGGTVSSWQRSGPSQRTDSFHVASGTRRHRGVHLDMPKITLAEARAAGEELGLPPIITLQEAAIVARQSPYTIKRKVSEGYFPKSARPGKPLRF